MRGLFNTYRVLATIVGVAIITLVIIGLPLKYAYKIVPDFWPSFLAEGYRGQRAGAWISQYVGTAHGFIYMVFVLVVLLIASKSRWPAKFTIVTLISGLIPFLTFWAEVRVIRRVRTEFPEVSA